MTRIAAYETISTSLALISDRDLDRLLQEAPLTGSGIGGTTRVLEIAGRPVFTKSVPLTELERRPENVRSTANVFHLPTFYQYGAGSAGFGAWRELAAHVMTTNWVLSGQSPAFPLMYHWRILSREPAADPGLAQMVDYWHGSAAVKERLEQIAGASARIVLFLEHFPYTAKDWLAEQIASGDDTVIDAACDLIDHGLRTGVQFMNARGLAHFDAHFRNILTDGMQLYFADFGLATSPRFALTDDESRFLAQHATYDRRNALSQFVYWLVKELSDPADPFDVIQQYAKGAVPSGFPPAAAAIITRYAPMSAVMNEFYRQLHSVSRMTAYPAAQIPGEAE